jgi:hypothetical protein
MHNTDWRSTRCPGCGEMRAAQEHPVCRNPKCGLNPEQPIYEQLELSTRLKGCLCNSGIKTMEQFLALTFKDVMNMNNAGRLTAKECMEMQEHLLKDLYPERLKAAVADLNRLLAQRPSTVRLAVNSDGLLEIYTRLV